MSRRQLTLASRVQVGDLVRTKGEATYRRIVRVTGSPGRRSPGKAPLLRFFFEGTDNYVTFRADAAVDRKR